MRLQWLWLLAVGAVLGCSGGPSDAEGATGGAGAVGGTGGGGGSAGAVGMSEAQRLFGQVLAGAVPAREGLLKIAQTEGFPFLGVRGGFVFARLNDAGGDYRVAGDFDGWQGTALEQTASIQWLELPIAAPDAARYKYLSSSDNFSPDPLARRYGYDQFGEFSLVRQSSPHRERFPEVGAASIAPRSVRVFVPGDAVTHHLYLHDGQNLFEPNAPFGGWKLDESLPEGVLAIGIDNAGGARMDEYTPVPDVISGQAAGGQADAYADYVKDVVIPLAEARYGAPAKRGVMGSSLGGLLAFHETLRDPNLFDFAASLSGTFGWGSIGAHNQTLLERFAQAGHGSTKLYFDSGGGPGAGCIDSDSDGIQDDTADASDNYCENIQLRDVLVQAGYVFDQDLWHWWESGATHDEAAWAARVFRPLGIFSAL